MALVDSVLSAALLAIFNAAKANPMSKAEYANQLAAAIDAQIKTAQVNAGIPVSTAGSATAQTGATTGPGTLS
ncbi:hypothetical protein LQZ19_08755 [Treponema primitia]|uniref:hypothetical protein n=1 Tax=Treponema primitia TaxID=88058 RepID=UPI00397FAE0E